VRLVCICLALIKSTLWVLNVALRWDCYITLCYESVLTLFPERCGSVFVGVSSGIITYITKSSVHNINKHTVWEGSAEENKTLGSTVPSILGMVHESLILRLRVKWMSMKQVDEEVL